MARRKGWTDENELIRIEAIATFCRVMEMADSTFDAIEQGDMARAVERLARLKGKAARGKYLLTHLPELAVYDNGVGE